MKRALLAAFAALFFALPASATTWYVRTDGGTFYSAGYTYGQCNGTANASYVSTGATTDAVWTPATAYTVGQVITDNVGHYETVTTAGTSGTGAFQPSWGTTTTDGTVVWSQGSTYPINQNCAVSHPFWLVDQSAWTWLTAAGDTIQFADLGPYYMGQHNNTTGLGYSWGHCSGNQSGCALPTPIPNNTKIYGHGVGSCHQTDPLLTGPSVLTSVWNGHGALKNATQLLGINGTFYILSLQGATSPDVECLDISQPDECQKQGAVGLCNSNADGSDFTTHGIFLQYQSAQGPIDAVMKDIEIHGTSGAAIAGGRLNTATADTFTADDIYLMGNGSAGWSWDGGSGGTCCENIGDLNFNWIRIEWNGCVEVKPNGGAVGENGYSLCADDSDGNYGYGDGWAMIATQGAWVFNHMLLRWNTQDGFDSLHTSDDLAHQPTSILLENSWSEGNEGQTFKIGPTLGSGTTAVNNVSVANCYRLSEAFSPNPSGYNSALSDFCRAFGDQWAIEVNDGMSPLKLIHNTSVGYGDTMYDIGCVSTCTTTTQLVFQNNISVGYLKPVSGGQLAAGFFIGPSDDPFANAGSIASYNDWYSMRGNTCPQDSHETNYICTDPTLTDASIDSINPVLLTGSPAIQTGVTVSGITTDFSGNAFASPPSMGSLEYFGPAAPSASPPAAWWAYAKQEFGEGRGQ